MSWKAIPTQTTWSIVPHSMVKKECVVRVNSRVMFLQCTCHSFEFFTPDCFRGEALFCEIGFLRSKTRRRGVRFLFFVFFFLTAKVVLIKVPLYVEGCLERGAFN